MVNDATSENPHVFMGNSGKDDCIEVLISSRTASILNWVLLAGICQGVALFGTFANIVNIVCFIKQGFKDSVDISLFGLAVSDLASVLTIIWSNICNTPAFSEADWPFDVYDVFYLTSVMPHLTFVRTTAWITALITLERCLCITIPLKIVRRKKLVRHERKRRDQNGIYFDIVACTPTFGIFSALEIKNLITVKRACIIIACVFIICTATGSPIYVVSRLGLKFSKARNKTVLGLVHTADKDAVEKPSYTINNTVIPIAAFVVVSVCTVVLVFKLQQKSKWRQKSSALVQSDVASQRSQRVAKMVVMISTLFIACFIPMSVLFIAIWLIPGLAVNGKNMSTFLLIGGIGTILESVNASMNIFIYIHMSSKYRVVFRAMFSFRK